MSSFPKFQRNHYWDDDDMDVYNTGKLKREYIYIYIYIYKSEMHYIRAYTATSWVKLCTVFNSIIKASISDRLSNVTSTNFNIHRNSLHQHHVGKRSRVATIDMYLVPMSLQCHGVSYHTIFVRHKLHCN